MNSKVSIALTLLSTTVLACCIAHAAAYAPPTLLTHVEILKSSRAFSSPRHRSLTAASVMAAHGAEAKPGTGENRMTKTGFKVPLVEKISVPTSQGYEWKVREDIIDVKKMNMQEKVKLAKPGLSIIDELEKLAAEAKEKGGAQV